MKDYLLSQEECDWKPSKHNNKPCPKHGFESDLTDSEQQDIKRAGGLDANKYVDLDESYRREEARNKRIVKQTENRWNKQRENIVSNPEQHFTKNQLNDIEFCSKRLGMTKKRFLEKVAFEIVVHRNSPREAIEKVYYNE